MFPHWFCRMHRLLSGIYFASALSIFRRSKRCLWHHNAKSTGHPIQQSTTTFSNYVGGEVMVFVWGCSNHHEFGYLSHDVVFDNQPPMTQQYALMWWQNWDSNIKPCKTVEDWGQLDHKKRWWCVVLTYKILQLESTTFTYFLLPNWNTACVNLNNTKRIDMLYDVKIWLVLKISHIRKNSICRTVTM